MMQFQHHNPVASWQPRNPIEKFEMFDSSSSSSNTGVRSIGRSKNNHELNQKLQTKADELEKLFSAHKVRVNGSQMSSGARSQLGDFQLDAAAKNLERRHTFGGNSPMTERKGGFVDYDSNLLLKMVDNLEYNLKQSQLGGCKGDFYERYLKLRDAKLKEEKGAKGIPKRMKMRAIVDNFEQSWALMKEQLNTVASRIRDSVPETGNKQEETAGSFEKDEQAQKSQETSSPDKLSKDNHSKNLLRLEGPIGQPVPNSELRKRNVKAISGLRNVTAPLPSKNSARGKNNYVKDSLVYEDENAQSSNSMKNISLVNSSPSHVPSNVPNGQGRKGLPNRYKNKGEVKPFLRRGTGRGAGAGGSDHKFRPKMSLETQLKEGELDDSVENHELDLNPNTFESEKLAGKEPEVNPCQFESWEIEEMKTSQESESSTILDYAKRGDDRAGDNWNVSSTNVEVLFGDISGIKSRPSLSDVDEASDIDDSLDTTSSPHHPKLMKDARIQWESPVKTNLDGNTSARPRRNMAKGLKKLFNFRRKNKSVEKRTSSPISTPYKHDDLEETGEGSAEQSTDDSSNLRIGCLASSYAGLNEGKIFPEQVNIRRQLQETPMGTKRNQAEYSPKCNQIIASRSLFSFPSFRRRGGEAKA